MQKPTPNKRRLLPANRNAAATDSLHEWLEYVYERYNRPQFIAPDPLQFAVTRKEPEDREIVALIASSLAFGGVRQISASVQSVLKHLGRGHEGLMNTPMKDFQRLFCNWRHRYVQGEQLCDLLRGMRTVLAEYGSLETCFVQDYRSGDETIVPALTGFVRRLRAGSKLPRNYLLPPPELGSACKRLNLFLRWMVRRDAVDPGGWSRVSPSKLVIPLDTHMHRISLVLNLTGRKQANLTTAFEITRAFALVAPDDPVRYDFALTRLGIMKEMEQIRLFSRSEVNE